jgi:hypothetical protein
MGVLDKVDFFFMVLRVSALPFLGATIPTMNLDFSRSFSSSRIFGMAVAELGFCNASKDT